MDLFKKKQHVSEEHEKRVRIFRDGWTLEKPDSCFNNRYVDKNGNKSELFYYTGDYKNGFAIVKRTSVGSMHYRDKDGNVSEPFYKCNDYRCGLALVKKDKFGPYQFRDKNGVLSEEFAYAEDYNWLYALVEKEENGPYQIRNSKGKLSLNTYNNYDEAKRAVNDVPLHLIYLASEEDVYDISPKDVLSNLDDIQTYLKGKYQKRIEESTSKEEVLDIEDDFSRISDYIKQTAYDEHKRQVEENELKATKKELFEKDLF